MEHRRPNGSLMQGYFCGKCGEPSSMMGHEYCDSNPKLVKACALANRHPRHGKPHFTLEHKPKKI